MRNIKFNSLEDAFDCYGRENLVPLSNIRQVIEYTKYGCQPKFVYENELKPGMVTFWFLRAETEYLYKLWTKNNPKKS